MATIAPVAVSVALWLVTGSVFALVFAALGPAVAIASLADARLQSRRRSRRETRRFDAEVAATRSDLAAAHDRERAILVASSPAAARLVEGSWRESEQWLGGLGEPVVVGIGRGLRASGVVLDGMPTPSRANGDYNEPLRALAEAARTVTQAPVVVDARLGVGIVGVPEVCNAVARSVLVQVLATLSPATHEVDVCCSTRDASPTCDWSWLGGLPHALDDGGPISEAREHEAHSVVVRAAGSTAQIVVAVAPDRSALPRSTRIVVRVHGTRGSIEQHPDPAFLGPVVVELTSREQAAAVVRRLAAHAAREGLAGVGGLPDAVGFDECEPQQTGMRRGGLACGVAVAADGPVTIDLVEHGPHAIVGGTTGSGKSELLTAWILSIARAHSPREASVLLVDFKGGSAFASLASLPHCVGVLTDLDEVSAARALDSLAAELRRRERLLAAAGAKSVDAQGAEGTGSTARLPRLVIVVDEFAAMVSGFPELHGLFGDIAARGRSLGVHLILCTQRPAGVIRDAVLANSAIRISLRVNNRADSTAVIGTDAAAALPSSPRGRAFVSAGGDEPVLAQFPLVTAADVAAVARSWAHDGFRPHRPWLDPLPSTIERRQLEAEEHGDERGIAFGVLDDPANQAQPLAFYRAEEHGNLLVLGGAGSGKSTLLDSIGAGAGDRAARLPHDVEGAWDALVAMLADIRSPEEPDHAGPTRRIVLIDDLDVVVSRFGDDYESAVLDLLNQCLREGPARGIHFVLAAQRLTTGLHTVAALCGSRLLLRLPSRQEHVLAGGDGQDFGERLPPGAGRWLGLRLQTARADVPAERHPEHGAPARGHVLDLSRPLAVVSNHPGRFVARLHGSFPELAPASIRLLGGSPPPGHPEIAVSVGARPTAIVGDVDAWQADWGALAALRSTHTVVVEGCSAGEFRSVTRSRALPPPTAPRGDAFWVLTADGGVVRARLPGH